MLFASMQWSFSSICNVNQHITHTLCDSHKCQSIKTCKSWFIFSVCFRNTFSIAFFLFIKFKKDIWIFFLVWRTCVNARKTLINLFQISTLLKLDLCHCRHIRTSLYAILLMPAFRKKNERNLFNRQHKTDKMQQWQPSFNSQSVWLRKIHIY